MGSLEIHELTKTFGQTCAVDRVCFKVDQGSLTVLLGPSGCGKSTVLRLIAGLEAVTSGRIHIGKKEVTFLDPSQRGVSMVFQSYALFPHLNVRDNILFGLRVRKVERTRQQERLEQAVDILGLGGLLDRKPSQLSGGQRQRVALARSIVSRRPVCLMDEPLSNLDARLRADMRREIRSLQQTIGLTMLYVTHDQVEAMTMADQVVLMNQGRIEQAGTPAKLYDRPATTFVATFMGSPPMNLLHLTPDQAGKALAGNTILPENHFFETSTFGIRPEHICLGAKGLEAKILSRDYLGSETVFSIGLNDQVIFAKTPTPPSMGPGQAVGITWAEKHLSYFDHKGKRLQMQPTDKMSVSA